LKQTYNLEPPLWTIVTEPGHIVRWAWPVSAAHRCAAAISISVAGALICP
jgi:hypothetical protein